MTSEINQLIPYDDFEYIFKPLQKKKIQYIQLPGNPGDFLIRMATRQLFAYFGIDYFESDYKVNTAPCDEVVISGGGNMGDGPENPYKICLDIRKSALALGRPVTVLPQSFFCAEDLPYKMAYVRDYYSLQLCKVRENKRYAYDLALALKWENNIVPDKDIGVFLRNDAEKRTRSNVMCYDPASLCDSAEDYLNLSAQYKAIITDRLHFAICGLINKKQVTLLPNTYHKNKSIFICYLQRFGCNFLDF